MNAPFQAPPVCVIPSPFVCDYGDAAMLRPVAAHTLDSEKSQSSSHASRRCGLREQNILFVDLSESADPLRHNALAEVASLAVVIAPAPVNDVRLYRDLVARIHDYAQAVHGRPVRDTFAQSMILSATRPKLRPPSRTDAAVGRVRGGSARRPWRLSGVVAG